MLQLPQTTSRHRGTKTASLVKTDPIFSMIETHVKLQSAWNSLYIEMDDAEHKAGREHGLRPIPLVSWRGYQICGAELDTHRERLLEMGEIDAATIEREFLEAKAREQALIAAGRAWDKRAGLAGARRKLDRALRAERHCAECLAKTSPTTPAGAGALVQYLLEGDLTPDADYWHLTALRSVVAGLKTMTTEVLYRPEGVTCGS